MSNIRPCKFDWGCTRPDCYFWHPNGRQIDFLPHMQQGGMTDLSFESSEGLHYDQTSQWYPQARNCQCCRGYMYLCSAPTCLTAAGPGQCMTCLAAPTGNLAPHNPDRHPDTWLPGSRNCNCCKGYVYNCSGATCAALGLGECGCVYEQNVGDEKAPAQTSVSDDEQDEIARAMDEANKEKEIADTAAAVAGLSVGEKKQ